MYGAERRRSVASHHSSWVRQALHSTAAGSGPLANSSLRRRNVPRGSDGEATVPRCRYAHWFHVVLEQLFAAQSLRLSARVLGKLRSPARRHTGTAAPCTGWPPPSACREMERGALVAGFFFARHCGLTASRWSIGGFLMVAPTTMVLP
jgi:hypothetical protein